MNSVFGPHDSDAGAPHRILVLRSDRSEEADAWRRSFREMAAERGVPTFDEVPQAIHALGAFRRYELFLSVSDMRDPAPAGHAAPQREER
jgi:hypothetical protein